MSVIKSNLVHVYYTMSGGMPVRACTLPEYADLSIQTAVDYYVVRGYHVFISCDKLNGAKN